METKPDLILSDVWMDDGDGLTLLKQVRAHPEISTTPVIINSLPNAVIMHDPEGRILFSNARAEELFKLKPTEFLLRSVESLWQPAETDASTSNRHRELICLRKNGEEFPADVLTNVRSKWKNSSTHDYSRSFRAKETAART